MQFTILLDDGTKIKGRDFDKIEAAPSIAEEIVYTNNNFLKINAMTKTVGLAKRPREPGMVGTGTST